MPPKNLTSVGDVMSNLDHSIEERAEEVLKEKTGNIGGYPAYNFHGDVWYDQEEKKFFCFVMQYHQHIDTTEGETLEEIMTVTSDKYGDT